MQNLIDGIIRELEQKNYTEAIKYCNQLVAQFPKNYIFHEIKGNCFLEMGNFTEAIQSYSDAIEYFKLTEGKSNSEVASLYNRRGYALLKLKQFEEAIKDFNKATEYKPDFAEAYNNCGNAYRKLERYDDALSQCNKAIEYKPDFAEAYNNRGNIYYLFSRSDEAIFDYTRAIELRPNYAGAYYNRGAAYYYLQNKIIEAKSDWEKVIKLNPSYERELKGKLDKIDEALELMRMEGEIPSVSEPLSLVREEEEHTEPEHIEEEKEQEPVEETEEVQEQVLEIYSESETKEEPEPEETTEQVTETTEETEPEEATEQVTETTEETETENIVDKEEEVPEDIDTGKIIEKEIDTPEELEPEKPEKEKGADIEIPDIDFKGMFQDDEKEIEAMDELKPLTEIFEQIYQPETPKENIIPDEVKKLHKEIEEVTELPNAEKEKKDNFIEELIETEKESETEEIKLPEEPDNKEKITAPPVVIKPSYFEEPKERNIFKSPIFIIPVIFLVLVIFAVATYVVYNKFYSRKSQTTTQETASEQGDTAKLKGNIDSTQIKDTVSGETEKPITKEETKTQETKKENIAPDVTSIKNFVVIKEQDGIYLQVASLKDKNSADSKAAAINKKKINTKVVEADLGSKGKYYRVRIGPFKTMDEAKTAADKVN